MRHPGMANSTARGHSVPGRGRGDRGGRPSASYGPRPGYGEGRSQYYAPKASAPPASGGYRSSHPYAGAYEMRQKSPFVVSVRLEAETRTKKVRRQYSHILIDW
ncbi:hypothetical protein QE152_g25698 [Popillia japonica]|uniref:Uncharacterized protein n=1 Tax=Popillia japonica TaxID=7064 RepID=A0AAW1K099_POPJA